MSRFSDAVPGLVRILMAGVMLKRRPRRGWVEAGVREPESVAEHSFSLALASMLVSDLLGLDTEKAVRMALIHDLAEAYLGDLTRPEKRRAGVEVSRRAEKKILETLFNGLPDSARARYLSLVEELLEGASEEARLVHELDKLEMALESLVLEEENGVKLSRFRRDAPGTGVVGEILREALRSHLKYRRGI